MTVDDGIDIIAPKESKYFHIQVKTSNPNRGGDFKFTVDRNRFKIYDAHTVFYIFVMRMYEKRRHANVYATLPSLEVKRLIDKEVVKDSENLNFIISNVSNDKFILNKVENITHSINAWNHIK